MIAIFAASAAALTAFFATPDASIAGRAGDDALAKFSTAWDGVRTYTCTITAHETRGTNVQDRVYHLAFARPNNMRMDIVGGAGRGGSAIWSGGDTVYGHQGGFLSFIRLHLNIHDPKAVSLRGTTVAQASFGALVARFKALKTSSLDATSAAGLTTLTATILNPATESGVTREVLVFGPDHLPAEYYEYQGNLVVDHVRYSDYKGNVTLPASTWKI
jgi:outer membrane lipoprotein-sorting protein